MGIMDSAVLLILLLCCGLGVLVLAFVLGYMLGIFKIKEVKISKEWISNHFNSND